MLKQPIVSRRTVTLAALGLIVANVLTLIVMFGKADGFILVDTGRPRHNEFVGVLAAGQLALAGQPAQAYDWQAHLARQRAITDTTADQNYPWSYPPTYLLVATVLASLPVVASAVLWLTLTLGGYLWVISRAAGLRLAALWAAATPATYINAMVVHTGFWTSGLMGLALVWVRHRPLLAGLCFGLLSMKPQLGLLVPVALVAGGHWRVIGATIVTAMALAGVSVLCFGIEPWLALLPQMARVSHVVRDGQVSFEMLVTVYGALRQAGAGDGVASAAQAVTTLALAIGVFRLWRSTAGQDLKAAGLASASLLATPYMFTYDLTMLAVVVAFLYRDAGEEGLLPAEIATLASAAGLLFFFGSPFALGLVANLLTAAVVGRRCWPSVAWRGSAVPMSSAAAGPA
jgi:arabinofuranan 3-O-arabinosyltransferase